MKRKENNKYKKINIRIKEIRERELTQNKTKHKYIKYKVKEKKNKPNEIK